MCTTDGKGDCTTENITYTIKCMEECGKKDIYYGETSYNTYTRGNEHLQKYHRNDPKSMLIQHCNIVHEGRKVKFKIDHRNIP